MHKYLRAAGFSAVKHKKDEAELIQRLLSDEHTLRTQEFVEEEQVHRVEYRHELDHGMGVCLVGDEYHVPSEEGEKMRTEFHLDHYYPYLNGGCVSSKEECSVQRHTGRETFAGMLDEYKVGISLIFYINNAVQYQKKEKGKRKPQIKSVNLSGWSIEGKVLLPIKKTARQIEMARVDSMNRQGLLEAAKRGDEDAMESLTIEDIDLYSQVSRRLVKEDIYTIIESCFMPCGVECDQYSVIGEITAIEMLKNAWTGEQIYNLTIDCNDIPFHVGINKKDLLGEPQVGRRFKGQIWMQGVLNFKERDRDAEL